MPIICCLDTHGLHGHIEYHDCWNTSYIVRIFRTADKMTDEYPYIRPIYVQSYGNGVAAENKLLELLEYPAWTMLKYS